ncbi:MAG TPA: hypothetical protein PKD64_16575 [Pirellulaceae bacterium]|nr:hypothetical protein [Pirellulaceae bacterium]HMO93806.1 hypothetical protein [Pirellulaceae bacterium]HMP70600.1 hypothetical protein [Pirellulaceae bacterium]
MNENLELPVLDSSSLGLWLSLLVDRELTDGSQRQLVQYLDENPMAWRACAIAFWDNACLMRAYDASIAKQGSRNSDEHAAGVHRLNQELFDANVNAWTRVHDVSNVASSAKIVPKRNEIVSGNRNWSRVLSQSFATAILLIGVFAGGWLIGGKALDGSNLNARESNLMEEINEWKQRSHYLAAGWAADQATLRSVADLFPEAPMLVEVENTPWRTVYLTDRAVSDQMIRALATMSAEVNIEPYQPEIMTPLWQSLVRPVVAIEVNNNGFSYLTGVSQ